MAQANGSPEAEAQVDTSPLPPQEPAPDDDRRPVFVSRLGRVKCCVWANHSPSGTRYAVTFQRLYKPEGTDTWHSASNFGRDDLPLVAKLADAAHSWIFATQQHEDVPF
jgi:hypothetical protein